MSIFELLILAIGLSMDSFDVSVTSGVVLKPFRISSALKIASFLALFQGAMPLIGWFIGREFQKYIQDYDHWVAFGVLLILGINMIREGRSKDEETPCCFNPAKTKTLLGLSVATSIDALAVGVSFAFLSMNMLTPTAIIIGVTFACSMIALYLGRYCGRRLKHRAEMLGGVILILIGTKILIEHLFFQ